MRLFRSHKRQDSGKGLTKRRTDSKQASSALILGSI